MLSYLMNIFKVFWDFCAPHQNSHTINYYMNTNMITITKTAFSSYLPLKQLLIFMCFSLNSPSQSYSHAYFSGILLIWHFASLSPSSLFLLPVKIKS